MPLCPSRYALLVEPRAPGNGVEAGALFAGQALERTERAFTQAAVDVSDRHVKRFRHDVRGLMRARQIARHDTCETRATQRLCRFARLVVAVRVERNVGMALPAAGCIPVGLPMTDKIELATRHER